MVAIAALLGAEARDLAEARAGRRSLPDLVWSLLERSPKPWLMVMDDLEEADAPAGSGPFAWARPSRRGLMVVTTRTGNEPKNEHRIQRHVLSGIPRAAAAEMLLSQNPEAGARRDAEGLSEILGGLPLSLSLSSACLSYSASPVSSFRDYQSLLLQEAPEAAQGDLPLVTLDAHVASILNILDSQGISQGRPLLGILSHFAAGVPLPEFILRSLRPGDHGLFPFADESRLQADIEYGVDALDHLGLLHRSKVAQSESDLLDRSLQMIPAVAQICRRQLEAAAPPMVRAVRAAAASGLESAVRRYIDSDQKDWVNAVFLLPHVFSLLSNMPAGSPEIAVERATTSACAMADYLLAKGAYQDAENLARKAHGLSGSFEDDHPLTLDTGICLASALMARGQFGKAEELISHVLSVRQRVLGPGHPETLRILEKLALCLRGQSRLREAELAFGQVVSGRQRILSEDNADTLRALASLSEVLWAQGKVGQAERFLKRVTDGRLRVLEPNSERTITAIIDLAAIQRNSGRLAEAETALAKVLGVRERLQGDDDPETLTALIELAATWRRQGRLGDAEEALARAVEVRARALGPDDPDTLEALVDLAEILRERGKPEEAHTRLRHAYEIQRKRLSSTHPDVLCTAMSLGIVLRDLGEWVQAEEVLRSAIASYEMVAGPEHPITLCAWHNLAAVLLDMGRFDEAEEMCKHVLDLREWTLGPNHPDTLDALANIGCLLRSKGALKEAEDAFDQALAGYTDLFGVGHPASLTIRANLAGVLSEQGRLAEADEMCRKVVAGREDVLGPAHPDTTLARINLAAQLASGDELAEAESILLDVLDLPGFSPSSRPGWTAALYNLAVVYRRNSRLNEAERILREVVSVRADQLGGDHPDTLAAHNELARVLREMGLSGEAAKEYETLLKAAERFVLEGCD
jgi:tetratricopeptide (TPR) repeat protein